MNDACSQHQPSRRRSNSTGRQSGFQVRANNLVRKLGMLTSKLSGNARSKLSDSDSKVKEPDTYPYREARSMDLMRTKPFMSSPMLAINFQSQSLGRRSVEEESTQSHSNESGDATMPSSDAVAAAAQGLAAAAIAAEASLRPSPEIQEQTRSPTQVEGLPPGGLASPELTAQSNSPQAPTQMRSQRPEPPLDTESIHQKSSSNNNDSAPSSSKRPAVPRLNTLPPLPPLSLSLKGTTQDQRLSRLSPSVIVRPPPFPILDLPAVRTPIAEHPTVSPSHMHARKAVRLNSMPMLPMEGRDERENDPEHEHYGLDEDEEGDEDAEGDEENTDAHMESDDDEDEIAGRSSLSSPSSSPSNGSGFLARTRGLSLRLPELLPTSNLSAMLGSVGVEAGSSSAGAGHARPSGLTPANADFARMQRDDVATPKAANGDVNGSVKRDYFSFPFVQGASAEARAKQGDLEGESHWHPPRTPTARDYAAKTPTQQRAQPGLLSVASQLPEAGSSSSALTTDAKAIRNRSSTVAVGMLRLPTTDMFTIPPMNLTSGPNAKAKRPGMYHHASKSMVELFSPSGMDAKGKGKGKELDADLQELISSTKEKSSGKGQNMDGKNGSTLRLDAKPTTTSTDVPSSGANSSIRRPSAANGPEPPSLRRQSSMPTFNASGPPPPYPTFFLPVEDRHPAINPFMLMPRDDEGREALPCYSNGIHLAAVLPRKMEFTASGVPSRDRKWRRAHVVLEGTAFRVYAAPPRVSGVSVIEGWWESKVGVGDVSLNQGTGQAGGTGGSGGVNTNIVIGRKEPKRRMKWEEELQAEEERNAVSGDENGGVNAPDASTPRESTAVQVDPDAQHAPKAKRHHILLPSHFLHPNRSRISLSSRTPSPSPSSPRSSLQVPRSSAELSSSSHSASSARPSVDSSTSTPTSIASSSTSAASLSDSSTLMNVNASASPVSSPRRSHSRGDSAPISQTLIPSHSRSNSVPPNRIRDQSPSQNPSRARCQSSINVNLNSSGASAGLPEPDPKDLLRVYSLQHAESGLASDYTKRRNVVRVRMEGEQFLLQCTDVAGVVEWIEGLQAAANIALDLDERAMPRGPIFPRRRRRRRAQRTESTSAGGQPPTV